MLKNNEYFQFKNGVIYCGDALELLPHLENNFFDVCLTDPDYNIENIGKDKKKYIGGMPCLSIDDYGVFCREWFSHASRISERQVFTPGISNECFYPRATWTLCWNKPNVTSFSRIGAYNYWEPVLIYGKPAKKLQTDTVTVYRSNLRRGIEKNHPCPKPIDLWWYLLFHFAVPGGSVLDPFAGSGTTAVVAEKLQISWVCIERVKEYCEIIKRRVQEEEKQRKLFPVTRKEENRALFEEAGA